MWFVELAHELGFGADACRRRFCTETSARRPRRPFHGRVGVSLVCEERAGPAPRISLRVLNGLAGPDDRTLDFPLKSLEIVIKSLET